MEIDYAYILAAGKGTRMGKVGQHLPKVLWPIGDKTLLELQYIYLKSLGAKKVFINLHHQSKAVEEFINSKESLRQLDIIHEEKLLGSGGAIHNLCLEKSISKDKPLFVVNCDQFLFFDESICKLALKKVAQENVHLFCIPFDEENYNQVVIKENKLTEIRKELNKDSPKITFSGVSIINLEKLKVVDGESSYFDTVANYKTGGIVGATNLEKFEYIDFGTLERYCKSIELLQDQEFLKKNVHISNFFKNTISKNLKFFQTTINNKEFCFSKTKNTCTIKFDQNVDVV